LGPARRLSRHRPVRISRRLRMRKLKRIPKPPTKPRRKPRSLGAQDGGHDASAVANKDLKFQTNKKTARFTPGGFEFAELGRR
jgi:hypothetical protein